LRALNFALAQLCRHNKDGSFGTQKNRYDELQLMARELRELGFNHVKHPSQFKPKHVYALLAKWQSSDEPVAVGTVKNRMSALRWVGDRCNNRGFIRSSNDDYGIAHRSFVGPDKAAEFSDQQLNVIEDSRIRLSAELQKHFGLRREEALKFTVSYADRGNHISLKSSWCKGGRAREIPVVTDEQRHLLNRIREAVGNSSLIPAQLKYHQHLKQFEKTMHSVGLGRTHGARHNYAQTRYTALTSAIQSRLLNVDMEGFKPPAQGGLKPSQMNQLDRNIDREARARLSEELGHSRVQICANYLGG